MGRLEPNHSKHKMAVVERPGVGAPGCTDLVPMPAQPTCLKEFKAPVPRPSMVPRVALRQKPLAEDVYTSALQRIVERDYFPELPYLRAKQALEDAIQTRDPQRIRVAYAELRRCSKTPSGRKLVTPSRAMSTGRMATPGTPGSSFSADPESRENVSVTEPEEEDDDVVDNLVCYKIAGILNPNTFF